MTVTQRFQPPFALNDVDAVSLDFEPALATGDTISSPLVTVTGGFTVGTPDIGTIDAGGNFTTSASGKYVRVLLTATTVGIWDVTFRVTATGGRLLHRTERQHVVAARS